MTEWALENEMKGRKATTPLAADKTTYFGAVSVYLCPVSDVLQQLFWGGPCSTTLPYTWRPHGMPEQGRALSVHTCNVKLSSTQY